MSLYTDQTSRQRFSSAAESHSDFNIDQAKKVKRTFAKRRDGTEGVTAVDERTAPEKFEESKEFFGDEDGREGDRYY